MNGSHSVMSDCLSPHGLCSCVQAPVFVGLSRQEYWSRLLFPSPGTLHDPGIELASPTLAGKFSIIQETLIDSEQPVNASCIN